MRNRIVSTNRPVRLYSPTPDVRKWDARRRLDAVMRQTLDEDEAENTRALDRERRRRIWSTAR